jgi:hypothetical protein
MPQPVYFAERMERSAQFMPEAEVTLRLAFWLLEYADDAQHADIAIDGAHHKARACRGGADGHEELR